jgi:hypothetical protein
MAESENSYEQGLGKRLIIVAARADGERMRKRVVAESCVPDRRQ